MEEIWQNSVPGQPMNGQTRFETFAPYNQAGACLLVLLAQTCGNTRTAQPGVYTTHPDQHGGIVLPGTNGGIDLLAGDDGGNYRIHTDQPNFNRTQIGEGNQNGFHTLLPYEASMAKDGTVYAGLQDNGELKITPAGKQYEVFGGDGFFSSVDPDNSKIAYEEYTNGAVSVTTDGGATWTSIDPGLTASLFATPFSMDPKDARHLLIGGRDIYERKTG